VQRLRGHPDYLSRLADDRRVEGGLPGQQAELAEEAPRAVDGDRGFDPVGVGVSGYQPLEDHEKVVARVALAVEVLPDGRP
jgi:hypothetical protein